MEIHRRKVLIGAAATLLSSMVATPVALAAMRDRTRAISLTAIPAAEPSAPYAFDLFYDLSRYLTARVELDRDFARLLFAEFSREEWGWANAGRLYVILRRELDSGTGSGPELLMSGRLSDLDHWFGRHMLDGWFEGIYRYDGAERRVAYEQTLMWETVRDLVPVQGLSDRDYGYWAEAPKIGVVK